MKNNNVILKFNIYEFVFISLVFIIVSCSYSRKPSLMQNGFRFHRLYKYDETYTTGKDLGVEIKFNPFAPAYRQIIKGINFEGNCLNKDCDGFKEKVIANIGTEYPKHPSLGVSMNYFDLQPMKPIIVCCLCKTKLDSCSIMGLYINQCKVRFTGDIYISKIKTKSVSGILDHNNDGSCKVYSPDNEEDLPYWTHLNLYILKTYDN